MQGELRIRQTKPDDWQGVLPLFEQLYHGDIGPGLKEVFTTLATDPQSCIFVAEQDRKLIGIIVGTLYLDMDWEGRVAKLQAIVVNDSQRRQGTGTRLYEHFLIYAKRHKARAIMARVNRQNIEAITFYQTLSFTKTQTNEYIKEIR